MIKSVLDSGLARYIESDIDLLDLSEEDKEKILRLNAPKIKRIIFDVDAESGSLISVIGLSVNFKGIDGLVRRGG